MNDAVFQLDDVQMDPRMTPDLVGGLAVSTILELGREMFAAEPRLQTQFPERARRLARLIAAKAPTTNAAQFTAPNAGCPPQTVTARFARVPSEVIAELRTLQQAGELDAASAAVRVWGRLAA
ncbi:hypothetical protein [Phenylobacterium sp.]|uniref:hypothetical protein n=1 Tax=Phenylobacterium sp. TaxID=1871053 RepID=UPI00286BE75D|nr:hypothetical protein [Phenylobacterium sp.]